MITISADSHVIELSILIPVKDEAPNIPALASEIETACSGLQLTRECIWVDDASNDATARVLQDTANNYPGHYFLILDKNYGQSAALHTAMQESRGAILATMDGDGQNDPADIPRLVNQLLKNKADMVNGKRARRRDTIIRKLSSRIGNGFRNMVTGENISDIGCSMRVFRRDCLQGTFVFHGMHRFIPTLARINGFERIEELEVNHRPRQQGQTRYGIGNRLWVGLADTLAVRWMKSRRVLPQVKTTNLSKRSGSV
ncbi:MAG: glycosyltransferase family 2 protein [Thermodesulfobacteriota bacterium]